MVNCKRESQALSVLKDTAIKIRTEGQRHLGAVISSSKYKHEHVQNKIDELIKEIKVLSMIGKTINDCFITASNTSHRTS